MDKLAIAQAKISRFPFRNRSRQGKRREKNFPPFFPRNPLISLDSDERIQGNPRKSNPHNPGFLQRKDHGPRKPKSTRSDPIRRSAERELDPLDPKAKRAGGAQRRL